MNEQIHLRSRAPMRSCLAEMWEGFVGCEKRIETLGPFIEQRIADFESPRILDAAMGIGCEVVYLVSHGYSVVGNEICEDLLRIARRRGARCGLSLNTMSINWLSLNQSSLHTQFDVILLLGNSLCLLLDKNERRQALENMFEICRDNGVLLIDERNFPYIQSQRDKLRNGQFNYSRGVMYCGERVEGRPSIVKDERVVFTYRDTKTRKFVGELEMYAFSRGELISIAEGVGWNHVMTYSDLSIDEKENAEFLTHVFRRTV